MKIDKEFEKLIPPLTQEEFKGLEQSILNEGCRDALILWNNTLIDGHNRYKICTEHNIPFKTINKDFTSRNEALLWIINNQLARRNLDAYTRTKLALQFEPIILQNSAKSDTREEIAHLAGVSHDTVARVKKIEAVATPTVKAELQAGKISINQAYQQIKNEARKADIAKQVKELEEKLPEQPEGLFDVIVIDPPWNYGTEYNSTERRVANPYPEMTQRELKAIKLPAADNCILFIWTTHKFIWDAKELLDSWGFKYRNILVWNKQKLGIGNLIRMQCEFCLMATKGKPIFRDIHTVRDIINEQGRQHSRKPEAFYELVDALCVGRKLDYFSRTNRNNWEIFGNDTNKF